MSNPKVNRGCAPLTANRTSADCVQISLGPSIPYIPLGVYHTGGFNAMRNWWYDCQWLFTFKVFVDETHDTTTIAFHCQPALLPIMQNIVSLHLCHDDMYKCYRVPRAELTQSQWKSQVPWLPVGCSRQFWRSHQFCTASDTWIRASTKCLPLTTHGGIATIVIVTS